MSIFEYEGFIRDNQSLGESTKTNQDGFDFDMQVPEKSQRITDLLTSESTITPAISKKEWTATSLAIFMLAVVGPMALGLLYMYSVVPMVQGSFANIGRACDTDPLWSNWATLFQVNIRSGYISFTASKIIDIAWDTIVGRGGQFLLAWISYHVYCDVMMHLVEREAIDFSLFTATMLYGHSIWTFWRATKSLFTNMSRRAIWMSLWMLASMIYVLMFPTLLSASTSYVAASSAAVLLVDNTAIPLGVYLESASYSLSNHGVPTQPSPWLINIANITTIPVNFDASGLLWRARSTVEYGGPSLTVDGVAYNISDSTYTRCGFHYGGYFYDKTAALNAHFNDIRLLPNNQAICQPDGKNYQWGASFELLIFLVLFQSLWAIGMWIAWIIAKRGSELARHGRKMGTMRAVLDIAKPLMHAHAEMKVTSGEVELRHSIEQQQRLVKYHIDHAIDGELLDVTLVEQ